LWRRFRPEHATAVEAGLSAAREEALAAGVGDEAAARRWLMTALAEGRLPATG
jgi:hypothetical protein